MVYTSPHEVLIYNGQYNGSYLTRNSTVIIESRVVARNNYSAPNSPDISSEKNRISLISFQLFTSKTHQVSLIILLFIYVSFVFVYVIIFF